MEIIIREAVIEDAKRIVEMFNQLKDELKFLLLDFSEKRFTEEDEKKLIKEFKNSSQNLFLVAEVNSEIVGTLTFIRESSKKKQHLGNIAMLVLKRYWGNGIGTRMLESIFIFSKKIGLKKILLEVFSNNKGAIILYQKNGFKIEGKIENAILDNKKYQDIIIMSKEI